MPVRSLFTHKQNAFVKTMLGLEHATDTKADLFSQACVEQYRTADFGRFGYLLGQIFEEHVLQEIAVLEELDYESVVELSYIPTAAIAELKLRLAEAETAPVVTQAATAACLISISRLAPAQRLLGHAACAAQTTRDRFEVAMLDFIVANRRDDLPRCSEAFARMRLAIEEGVLPPARMLHACSQAVVWYTKRKQLSERNYSWFLALGCRIVTRTADLDAGALSSWYRAAAMVPAASGDAKATRAMMVKARDAARASIEARPRAYEKHFLKTYYESALKEHTYVTRDRDRAVEAGKRLIDIDPLWAPSYGELAETYVRFGNHEKAYQLFDKAAQTGPPYVGHHTFCAAQCLDAIGEPESALDLLRGLTSFAPQNVPVALLGLKIANRVSAADKGFFEARFMQLRDRMTERQRQWLHAE